MWPRAGLTATGSRRSARGISPPGALIVAEAGGRVSKLDGEADYLMPPYTILAGNPAVHALMLREFQALGR